MAGLQVLSAPSNQPTLNPVVQPVVQPTLAPRVVSRPAQPTLAPQVVTQPQQPSLNPQVQAAQGQNQTVQTLIPSVVKGINGARLDGHTDNEILAQYIQNHPESQAPDALAAGHSASDILDQIISGQGYQPRKPGDGLGGEPNTQSDQGNQDAGRGILQRLIQPELTGIVSGLRGLQATPKVIETVIQALLNDPQKLAYAIAHPTENVLNVPALAQANETLQKPIKNVKPLAALNVKEAAGLAAQAAGQLTGMYGAPVLSGALYGGGDAALDNKSGLGIAGEAALGGVLGKVADVAAPYIGKGLSSAYGKVVPEALQNVVSQGAGAVKQGLGAVGDAAAPILDKITPDFVTKEIPGLGSAINATEGLLSHPIASLKYGVGSEAATNGTAKIIQQRQDELQKLEDSYKSLSNISTKADARGIDVKQMLSSTDLLHGAVDENGTVHTQDAISQLHDYLQPQESVITDSLKREGKTIPLGMVEQDLTKSVNASAIKGADKISALNDVKNEIAGLALEADKDGYIPLWKVQEAKVYKYGNINYSNPGKQQADKAIASGLKGIIENRSGNGDIEQLNKELGTYYTLGDYLSALDGKKVEGGRLGKYFAKAIGAIAGSHFGPVGSLIGSEVAGKVKGVSMAGKLSGKIGAELTPSATMQSAIEQNTPNVINLPPSIGR